jgi:hypothetical protein
VVVPARRAGGIATEAHQLGTLRTRLGDTSAFPGGRWPAAGSGAFRDASVLDGDADWSIKS